MKRIIMTLSILYMGITVSAQTGIIQVRPANDTDGKILTMEETILSKDLTPENLWCRWIDDTHIAMQKDGKWVNYDITTEETVPFQNALSFEGKFLPPPEMSQHPADPPAAALLLCRD